VVRLVTWNIQHGRRRDGTVDVAALVDACVSFEADVLALQEVDRLAPRSGEVDEVALIGEAAGMRWVFGEAMPGYGNALLSRGELEEVEVVALPHDSRREPRCAVVGTTMGIAVAACHLGLFGDAEVQLPTVIDVLCRRGGPHALLGDLNIEEPDLAPLTGVRAGPTFVAHDPRTQIDHVALAGLEVSRAAVLPEQPVSDHRPLLVETR
jgi:endonuclease/exonuclease/phosphatase family metal-dependent hydrolase